MKLESKELSMGGLIMSTRDKFMPRFWLLTKRICRYTTKDPTINATVAANWAVTNSFLKNTPLPDWLYLPLRTRMGLKEERTKAG